MQRRVEDIDAERRDAVAGLSEEPSRQRGDQVVVLGLGQVDVGDQSLGRAGVGGGDLLGELVLVTVGPVNVPQTQAGAGQVVVDDLAYTSRPVASGETGEKEPSFPFDTGVLSRDELGTWRRHGWLSFLFGGRGCHGIGSSATHAVARSRAR